MSEREDLLSRLHEVEEHLAALAPSPAFEMRLRASLRGETADTRLSRRLSVQRLPRYLVLACVALSLTLLFLGNRMQPAVDIGALGHGPEEQVSPARDTQLDDGGPSRKKAENPRTPGPSPVFHAPSLEEPDEPAPERKDPPPPVRTVPKSPTDSTTSPLSSPLDEPYRIMPGPFRGKDKGPIEPSLRPLLNTPLVPPQTGPNSVKPQAPPPQSQSQSQSPSKQVAQSDTPSRDTPQAPPRDVPQTLPKDVPLLGNTPTECRTPEELFALAQTSCEKQKLAVEDISYFNPCGDGRYQKFDYKCGPDTRGYACAGGEINGGDACIDPTEAKIQASDICKQQIQDLVYFALDDSSANSECGGRVKRVHYICCQAPIAPRPSLDVLFGRGDMCIDPLFYKRTASEFCGRMGLQLQDLILGDECGAMGGKRGKFLCGSTASQPNPQTKCDHNSIGDLAMCAPQSLLMQQASDMCAKSGQILTVAKYESQSKAGPCKEGDASMMFFECCSLQKMKSESEGAPTE